MTEWGVFGVIAAIVSLFVAVGVPLIKLNTTLTKLNVQLDYMSDKVKCIETKSKGDNEKLWKHNDKQDDKLDDHEIRIKNIEYNKEC